MPTNWIDVISKGAVGDGTTDDTTAIQEAIDEAGDRGVVLFPAGKTYRITSTLHAAYDDHLWEMSGARILVDFNGTGLQFGNYIDAKQNLTIRGGVVTRGSNNWTAGNTGVRIQNYSRIFYEGFSIYGFEKGLSLYGGGETLGTVTISIADPAVITYASHGFSAGQRVYFSTDGELPTGIEANVPYFVLASGLTSDTFQVATSSGGDPVETFGSQSGTHTLHRGAVRGAQSGTFLPLHIRDCKFGIHLTADYGGWCNEHAFLGGGRVGLSSTGPDATGGYLFYAAQGAATTNQLNNLRCFGICFESARISQQQSGAAWVGSRDTGFYHCRWELSGWGTSPFINNSTALAGLVVIGGFGVNVPSQTLTNPNTGVQYLFQGTRSNVLSGGTGNPGDNLLLLRERNSGNNHPLVIRSTNHNETFAVRAVDGRVRIGTAGAAYYPRIFASSTTYDPGTVVDDTSVTTTLTVANSEVGDLVLASFTKHTNTGVALRAMVNSANTVTVRFTNNSGADWTPGSGTLAAMVLEPPA